MRSKSIFVISLLIISSNIFIKTPASAANVTFSQTFTQSAIATSSVVAAWENFRAALSGSFNSFTWSSSNGASITVSDPTKIQTLADALRLGTATSTTIGSNTWYVGVGCGSTAGYTKIVEFSNQGTCSCATGYSIRPLIGNANWGGSNGGTCTGPTQTITITFFDSTPDTTPPTFTSSSTFSVPENILTSANAATIKVSESATVTISSGADAALFTIITSDSITAFIRFKTSPDYEAPIDAGGNNIYDITLSATDAAGNIGTQSITITVTDVLDTSSFNSFTLSGAATYRSIVTITANITVAAKVTFKAKNVIITGCKNKLASGSGSSFSVTCSWRPSVRGNTVLSATAVPTSVSISSSTATPLSVNVSNRSGSR